jgi:hypothetical protein
MNWGSVVPVVVALLGIGSAVVTGYLAGRRQTRLDYQKEARLAVSQLTRSIGVTVHTIAWFTWKAKNRASLLAPSDVQDYDSDMKKIFPELTGSLAVLAAFSRVAYERAKYVAVEVYALDERVAYVATGLLTEDKNAPAALASLHGEASRLESSLKRSLRRSWSMSSSRTGCSSGRLRPPLSRISVMQLSLDSF